MQKVCVPSRLEAKEKIQSKVKVEGRGEPLVWFQSHQNSTKYNDQVKVARKCVASEFEH